MEDNNWLKRPYHYGLTFCLGLSENDSLFYRRSSRTLEWLSKSRIRFPLNTIEFNTFYDIFIIQLSKNNLDLGHSLDQKINVICFKISRILDLILKNVSICIFAYNFPSVGMMPEERFFNIFIS